MLTLLGCSPEQGTSLARSSDPPPTPPGARSHRLCSLPGCAHRAGGDGEAQPCPSPPPGSRFAPHAASKPMIPRRQTRHKDQVWGCTLED